MEIIRGDWKIVTQSGNFGVVKKALGPWPLRNWSWVNFYAGTVEDCKQYIEWADHIEAEDPWLLAHVRNHTDSNMVARQLLHVPYCWVYHTYDFKEALRLRPLPDEKSSPDFSGELAFLFIGIIAVLIFGFFYHSV